MIEWLPEWIFDKKHINILVASWCKHVDQLLNHSVYDIKAVKWFWRKGMEQVFKLRWSADPKNDAIRVYDNQTYHFRFD